MVHGFALTHKTFCGHICPMGFLVLCGFLVLWTLLAMLHVSQGQAMWIGPNW